MKCFKKQTKKQLVDEVKHLQHRLAILQKERDDLFLAIDWLDNNCVTATITPTSAGRVVTLHRSALAVEAGRGQSFQAALLDAVKRDRETGK